MKGEMKIMPGKPLDPFYSASNSPIIERGLEEKYAKLIKEEGIGIGDIDLTKTKPKYDKLTSLTSSYFQEGDSMIDGDQQLELSTEDGGGGTYFVLKTDRWVFDSLEELSDLIQDFINTQKTIENGNH
jgi:hypothetical protein